MDASNLIATVETSGMDEVRRRHWLDRLEREAFGCLRPPEPAYAAFYATWHARVAWGVVLIALMVVAVSLLWGKGIALLLILAVVLASYLITTHSLLWGWFFYGHSMVGRVDAVLPTSTWKALQVEASNSESELLRQLSLRRWVTYRAAFAALGNPFPEHGVMLRGVGFRR